jgi:hypothetical protein
MTQRRFFFIVIIRSKIAKRKGGRMIASEFDDRSSAQAETSPMITRFKPGASVVLDGLSARIVSRGHPESLT